ncbi:MAG TPA: hypothetical protein VNZ52_17045 [Candidatus Thermoplasmatota archaeon]|nr:hypothetical protein [Candidatus Thermoplasmatota archaeon]
MATPYKTMSIPADLYEKLDGARLEAGEGYRSVTELLVMLARNWLREQKGAA